MGNAAGWKFDSGKAMALEPTIVEVRGKKHGLGPAVDPETGLEPWVMPMGDAPPESERRLALEVQLSPTRTYAGGEQQFLINPEGNEIPRVGNCLVNMFPSYIMTRVAPVTDGLRFSISTYAS